MENTQTGDVKMPITYEDLKQSLVDSGRPYDFDMIDRAYASGRESPRRADAAVSGEPYICPPVVGGVHSGGAGYGQRQHRAPP